MHVVAIIDQQTCRTYPDVESVPPGAVVFRSPEELGRALQVHSMDVIRGRLLGEPTENSPSREEASRRLWHVLSIGADFNRVDWSSGGYTTRKDNFGNKKIADISPIELIQLIWVKGKDSIIDHFYKKLAKQARQMVDMLVDDGRGLWTNEQANAVILARGAEVETKQGVLPVFNYYKSQLFQKKILRRVSYVEFASRPEFAAMALQDKE
jgi:hypothetical protein